MKSGKAWCFALSFLLAACCIPATLAQDQDQQKSAGDSVSKKFQDQNDSGSVQTSKDARETGVQRASLARTTCIAGKEMSHENTLQRPDSDSQDFNQYLRYPGWQATIHEGRAWTICSSTTCRAGSAVAGNRMSSISPRPTTPYEQLLNLPNGQGVVVLGVAPNSGPAQAGIEQNDILLTLGEAPLGKPEDLYDATEVSR